jgi:hypothetical protein
MIGLTMNHPNLKIIKNRRKIANIWKPQPKVDPIFILKQKTHLKLEPCPCLLIDLKLEVLLKMS